MAELNKLELRKKISDLLSEQKLAVLATWDEKRPHSSLIAYAYTEDLKFILFTTRKDTRKYQNIQKHPHISLLVDNRKNSQKDFENAVALTIIAKGEEINKQTYSNLYLARFPDLKEFLGNTETALILLKVQRYMYVHRFQEVLEFKM